MLNMPYFEIATYFERHASELCMSLGASLGKHCLIDFHFMFVSLGETAKRKYDPEVIPMYIFVHGGTETPKE